MDYQVVRNYEEYLNACKSLLKDSVGEDDFGTFVPFDSYEDWEQYFGAKLPVNEAEDEYLPIEDYVGLLDYRPNESEYPIILFHNFAVKSDFRNGDISIRLLEWKSIAELSLKIDENVLRRHQEKEQMIVGEELDKTAFIPFENENAELSKEYLPLAKTLNESIPKINCRIEGKDAVLALNYMGSTILRKGEIEFEKEKSVRHIIEILPSVDMVVTVSHKTQGLGKEMNSISFDGILVKNETVPDNITHFSKLFAFTGLGL